MGKSFDVRYSSLIARAQRMSEGQNIMRALQILQPMAQMKPEMMEMIDTDKVTREIWSIYGNKHDLLLDTRALAEMRKRKAAAQQEMLKQQKEQHDAELANKTAPMIAAMQQKGNPQNVPST